jgi:hypothetical protein
VVIGTIGIEWSIKSIGFYSFGNLNSNRKPSESNRKKYVVRSGKYDNSSPWIYFINRNCQKDQNRFSVKIASDIKITCLTITNEQSLGIMFLLYDLTRKSPMITMIDQDLQEFTRFSTV